MCPDKDKAPAWELSNTDSLEDAGTISTADGVGLMVIDYQNFNANKKGFLGHLFDDKNNAIQKTGMVIEKARKVKMPVIYLNTILNPALMPDTTLFTVIKKTIPWDRLSLEELKWNFDVIDELKPQPEDYIVQKGSWSNGFHDTDLRSIVRALKLHTLMITGLAEPIAIYGTFLGAWDEGLEIIMVEDCIMASGANPQIQDAIHHFSKNTFYPMMGARVTTSEFIKIGT